jgi:hypothetical protein
LPRGYPAGRAALEGDRLYVAADMGQVAIVDVSDLHRPEVLLPRDRKLRVIAP